MNENEILNQLGSEQPQIKYNKVIGERECDLKSDDELKNNYGYYMDVKVEEIVCGHRCEDWELVWMWNSPEAEAEYKRLSSKL